MVCFPDRFQSILALNLHELTLEDLCTFPYFIPSSRWNLGFRSFHHWPWTAKKKKKKAPANRNTEIILPEVHGPTLHVWCLVCSSVWISRCLHIFFGIWFIHFGIPTSWKQSVPLPRPSSTFIFHTLEIKLRPQLPTHMSALHLNVYHSFSSYLLSQRKCWLSPVNKLSLCVFKGHFNVFWIIVS